MPVLSRIFAGRWYESRLSVILESIVIGLSAGLVVSLFRLSLSLAETWRVGFFQTLRADPARIIPYTAVLAAAGLFLGWAIKVRPMIKGSGIPQIEGAMNRLVVLSWVTELPLKIVTGIIGLGAGLSLGREGPSIQIGAYTGQGILTLFRRPRKERMLLIAGASAAGLSAAFSAPLAGVLFALEEMKISFSPLYIACTMGASMTADAVASIFFGQKPIFHFESVNPLPLGETYWVILLGVICGLVGDIFKRSLYLAQDLYEKFRIPPLARPVVPLLLSIPAGLFFFDVSGGGHSLIESLTVTERGVALIGLLLAGRIVFTAVCYGSGTSGGIFLPLLACGALTGYGFGRVLMLGGIIGPQTLLNYLILGMAALFAAAVKAPVTGVILILEMSGNFGHLGSIVLVCLSAFVTTELIGSRPVYTVLLERMLKGRKNTGRCAA